METVKIKDIGKVITGSTPSTRCPEFFGDAYPFIKPSDITPSIRRVFSTETMLSEAGRHNQRTRLLPKDTTCVVCIGTIGKLCLTSRTSFTNQQLNSVIPYAERFDPAYVFYLFSTIIPILQKLQGGSASGREHVNKSNFQEIELSVHSLPIQRKIASILSAYDDLIENNTRRIAILEEMAQAIYREWFVNFRFPGHQNVKLVDSPLGQIPEGWEVTTLGTIADVNSHSIKKGDAPKNINYIDIASVSTGRIDEIRPLQYSESPGRARRIVRHGDVIWSTVRPVRKSYSIILNPLPHTIASTGFAVMSATAVPFPYLYFATTTDEFVTYLVNHATGSAYPAVNGKDFESADILLPSADVLTQFDAAVGDMLVLGHRLQIKNINLRATRDLLLPKLISGKLDVEDLDIDVGMNAEALVEAAADPKPRPVAANEPETINNGKAVPPPEAAPQPTPIDELDTDYVMAEFRQEARRLGTVSRAELLKAVSQALGYRRLGTNINEALKGHLRAALRRKIIAAEGDLVCLHTPAMDSYDRDESIEVFKSVMRKNQEYEREDVMCALANYLGFRRLTDTVREPIKSAINGAIRRGLLGYQGELIWRED